MDEYDIGTSPSPAQVKAARQRAGLTQKQSAEVVYVTSRAWAHYEAETCAEKYKRAMPAATFELYLIKTKQLRV